MTEIVVTGRIEGGKLQLRNRQKFDAALKAWRKDCEVIVTIEKAHATRSLEQNAFYWGVVVKTLAEYCGYTPLEMHEVFKVKFLPATRLFLNKQTGEVSEVTIGGTTTRLNKIQFGEYIAQIQQLGAEMGCYIPNPNEDSEAA